MLLLGHAMQQRVKESLENVTFFTKPDKYLRIYIIILLFIYVI